MAAGISGWGGTGGGTGADDRLAGVHAALAMAMQQVNTLIFEAFMSGM
jgi:hypothetical protein